jgi:hypothetical protein
MAKYGELLLEKLDSWRVNNGCDGDFVFERHRIGLTSQVCIRWFTKLIQQLSSFPNYPWCLALSSCCGFCSFFAHRLEKFIEFCKLTEIIQTKSLKLLKNVKTCSISMLSPLKDIMTGYKSLIVKMHYDPNKSKSAHDNLELLCDLELILGLP